MLPRLEAMVMRKYIVWYNKKWNVHARHDEGYKNRVTCL